MAKKGRNAIAGVGLIFVIMALSLIIRAFDSPEAKPLEASGSAIVYTTDAPDPTKVNVNTASLEELMTLEEIGEKRALAIIEYRETHGMFRGLYDLQQVDDIGEEIVAMNKDRIIF